MLLLLLFACSGSSADSADTVRSAACDTGADATWHSFGEAFFTTYCHSCHSATTPERSGAPEGVDFDTPEQVRAQAERIRVRVLEQGDMPVGGGVQEEDLLLLDRLLECGL